MDFKGSQFERDVILWGVRWYAPSVLAKPPYAFFAKRSISLDCRKITLDKSGANTAAIDDYNTGHETGIELMHMIRKGQLKGSGTSRPAQQFYSLDS